MKKLYYVSAYHRGDNQFDRYAVTALGEEYAIKKIMDCNEQYSMSMTSARFICLTPESVWQEL